MAGVNSRGHSVIILKLKIVFEVALATPSHLNGCFILLSARYLYPSKLTLSFQIFCTFFQVFQRSSSIEKNKINVQKPGILIIPSDLFFIPTIPARHTLKYYNKLFGVKGTVISMIILWVCVILLDLPNWSFLGLGSHAYSDFGMHCTFAITSDFFYNTVMNTGLAVLLPAIVIFFCYLNILIRTSSNYLFKKHWIPTYVKKPGWTN